MQDTESIVRSFLTENFLFGRSEETLSPDTSFIESGLMDSTGVLELVGFLEDRFGLSVADDELVPENLDTLARVTRFVERKRAASGNAA